ncbi:hypothetical protein ABH922_002798 [Rhodococcus sp. 27YEA15]|uniref:hypothetical protein n=1 Tax=Rhodococcus sp. 27YEA15 TaxID=3156259 RepID=UPI003C7D82C2
MTPDDNGSAASFFETLLGEAVGPFFVILDDGTELAIDVPNSDDVAELDTTASIHDQLDLLVADEDVWDSIDEAYGRRPIGDLAELVDDIREHFGILVAPMCGWAYLVNELDRYGAAIEKDLFGKPEDLYDWVRDHLRTPWDKLLRLLPALPIGGWYHAAIADDDDRAREVLKLEVEGKLPKPSTRPSLVGWTPEIEKLTEAVETLRAIQHGIWAASPKFQGKGGAPPRPLPRPLTARERVEEEQALVEHDDIASQLLGSRYTRRFSES